MKRIKLQYGAGRTFECELESSRVTAVHTPPAAMDNLPEQLRQSLAQPIEFPELAQAVVPDDHVVIAIDAGTPQAATIVAELWNVVESRGVRAEDVTLLEPAPPFGQSPLDPRRLLPGDVATQMVWRVHDPTDSSHTGYLAATALGDRIYLAREIVEADFVMSVGSIGFDPLMGYRGTSSVFYPGLSNEEAIRSAHAQGHDELGPDDERPLRQRIDEVSWLLGVQFTVQVIPATGDGVSAVLAGINEAVFRDGRALLNEHWRFTLNERPELVVCGIPHDAAGHDWTAVASALDTARSLVKQDGRIVLLTELNAELTTALEILRDSRTPRDALKPLRKSSPEGLLPATSLAQSLDWANVYLLSRLDDDLVEDLFMVPLGNETELRRLLDGDETYAFIGGAQHTFGSIDESGRG